MQQTPKQRVRTTGAQVGIDKDKGKEKAREFLYGSMPLDNIVAKTPTRKTKTARLEEFTFADRMSSHSFPSISQRPLTISTPS